MYKVIKNMEILLEWSSHYLTNILWITKTCQKKSNQGCQRGLVMDTTPAIFPLILHSEDWKTKKTISMRLFSRPLQ